jgi:type II secretory ATPase GspE/PulE/Tfp pilus assembly ATPase PilB-like protein
MDDLWKREAPPHLLNPRWPDESPELHLVSGIFWYSAEDHATAIRIEQKQSGALIQFRIDGVFQNKCEIDATLARLLMHRFVLMVPSNNIIHIVINDNRYALTFDRDSTDQGERVTIEITRTGIYRDVTFSEF